jgi:hypothetical protein
MAPRAGTAPAPSFESALAKGALVEQGAEFVSLSVTLVKRMVTVPVTPLISAHRSARPESEVANDHVINRSAWCWRIPGPRLGRVPE